MTKAKTTPAKPQNLGGRRSAPLSYSQKVVSKAPVFKPTKNGGTRISHRELIQDVNGSASFTAVKVPIQPGLATSFPWLAAIAKQYELYKIHSMHAEHVPAIGADIKGQVLLAADYDARDPNPSTEQQASSYAGAVSDRAWEQITLKFDTAAMHPMGPKKFVRDAFVSLTDIKTYDAANLFVCSSGETDSSLIGKLWLNYDIEFFNPQIPGTESDPGSNTSTYKNTSAPSFTSPSSQALEWNTVLQDGLGLGAGPSEFVLPKGVWNVDFMYTVKNTAAETMTLFASITAAGQTTYSVQSQQTVTNPANGTLQVNLFTTIPSDGTDTVQCYAGITAATGTLTGVASENRLRISPA